MSFLHTHSQLDRRAALITGASRGIGRGIALELAHLGQFDLVLNYATDTVAAESAAQACLEVARGNHVRVETVQADISIPSDRQRLIDTTCERFGRLDLLVNNAGVAPRVRADILEADLDSFDYVISTNLKGPYFLTQLAARTMIAQLDGRPAPPGTRNVVTITSMSAYTASTNRGDYCISKAGLAMHTRLWATRLAEYGIGVFEVRPGIVDTDMTAGVKAHYDSQFAQGLTPYPRWGTPSDVGKAVAAIAAGSFPYSTGTVIDVDGGFHLRRL